MIADEKLVEEGGEEARRGEKTGVCGAFVGRLLHRGGGWAIYPSSIVIRLKIDPKARRLSLLLLLIMREVVIKGSTYKARRIFGVSRLE